MRNRYDGSDPTDLPLFGTPRMPEGPAPLHRDARDTEVAAVRRFTPETLRGARRKCWEYIASQGGDGATPSEVTIGTGLYSYTARPRVTELAQNDPPLIADSGRRRLNERGNPEIVWIIQPAPGASRTEKPHPSDDAPRGR